MSRSSLKKHCTCSRSTRGLDYRKVRGWGALKLRDAVFGGWGWNKRSEFLGECSWQPPLGSKLTIFNCPSRIVSTGGTPKFGSNLGPIAAGYRHKPCYNTQNKPKRA